MALCCLGVVLQNAWRFGVMFVYMIAWEWLIFWGWSPLRANAGDGPGWSQCPPPPGSSLAQFVRCLRLLSRHVPSRPDEHHLPVETLSLELFMFCTSACLFSATQSRECQQETSEEVFIELWYRDCWEWSGALLGLGIKALRCWEHCVWEAAISGLGDIGILGWVGQRGETIRKHRFRTISEADCFQSNGYWYTRYQTISYRMPTVFLNSWSCWMLRKRKVWIFSVCLF